MNIIVLLAPVSLALGVAAVAAFLWSLTGGQYEDMRGAAERVLIEDADDAPGLLSTAVAPGADPDTTAPCSRAGALSDANPTAPA